MKKIIAIKFYFFLYFILSAQIYIYAQTKKDAIDSYNSGAIMIKENPQGALVKLYEALKISDQLGEEGEETKVLAESLIPSVHFEFAMQLYKEKKSLETLEQLEKAEETAVKYGDTKTQQKVEKTIPKLYYAMGVSHYKKDEFEKAIEYYNKAVQFNGGFSDPILGLALSYEKMADYEKMLEYLAKTIEVARKTNDNAKADDAQKKAKAYLMRNGDEAQKAEKFDEAVKYFSRVLDFDGNDGTIYYVLAINYNSLKDWDNAIENANVAVEKGNGTLDMAGVYYQLGVAYQGKGSNAEACESFRKASSGNYKAAAEYQCDIVCNPDVNKKKIAPEIKAKYPPLLTISNIKFHDQNNNNCIDGNEECFISFDISNTGKGSTENLKAIIKNISNTNGFIYSKIIPIENIKPDFEKNIKIPIKGEVNLTNGFALFQVNFEEGMGFPPNKFEIKIETKEYTKPNVQLVDFSFLSENSTIKLGSPVQLKVLIQNIGQGDAENVKVVFQYPNINVYPIGPSEFSIGLLTAGASEKIIFEFIVNKNYSEERIPITTHINEKFGQFGCKKMVSAEIDSKVTSSLITIVSNAKDFDNKIDIKVASLKSDVDTNIPQNSYKNPNRFALIIGNEDYSSRQRDLNSEVNVEFALNDASIFKEYCIQSLGVAETNVFFLTNATSAEINQKIELITQILYRLGNNAELIFFFAGHGFPDENTKEPYIMPVDVSATNLTEAIKLYDVYRKLSNTGAKRITVFLDACFTGGGRGSGLLAARAVKVRPKEDVISGNIIIFAATSEDQSALPYKEKQHGMFTYFLLKMFQESKGLFTYGELEEYVRGKVSIESLKINSKPQDPKANISPEIINEWKNWRFIK